MPTIVEIISREGSVSRNSLIEKSALSAPTVLQKVKGLINQGIIEETGVAESTGGRKAKLLSIVRDARWAAGVNITMHHVEMVLAGLNGQIITKERSRLTFEPTQEYYSDLHNMVEDFLDRNVPDMMKLLGTGVSLPGAMDPEKTKYVRSRVLHLDYYSISNFKSAIPHAVLFDNDANCAAYSEKVYHNSTAFYISINNTIGGAFTVEGKQYDGMNNRSSEVGHINIVPNGRKCYCGKYGCFDSYCSALQLENGNLTTFFEKLTANDPETEKIWDEYLEYLSIIISDLRILYDCDIILGGYVGSYLKEYMSALASKVEKKLLLDIDSSFIRCGMHKWEASAYGAALKIIDEYLSQID